MKTKTLDQIKTKYYGEIGTPERDRIERDLDALRIGLKIRTAREQNSGTTGRPNRQKAHVHFKGRKRRREHYSQNAVRYCRARIGREITYRRSIVI